MWSKVKNEIEEGYDYLTAGGYLKDVPRDDYMYEAWHNHCKSNPNSYHRNYRDDASVYINWAAMRILFHEGQNSCVLKRIEDLSKKLFR